MAGDLTFPVIWFAISCECPYIEFAHLCGSCQIDCTHLAGFTAVVMLACVRQSCWRASAHVTSTAMSASSTGSRLVLDLLYFVILFSLAQFTLVELEESLSQPSV